MKSPLDIVDLFAGPGGWDEGAHSIGLRAVGIEIDEDACASAIAAGHQRWRTDVLAVDPLDPLLRNWTRRLLVASPPCVGFSKLNKGHGRKHVEEIADAARRGDWSWGKGDLKPTLLLPLSMGPWIEQTQPAAIAFEQVPSVLPVWEAYADWLVVQGYYVWTGKLDAAHYGVPQHRSRAFLMAQREPLYVDGDGHLLPPTPTHGKGLLPCVTVGEALGWTEAEVTGWVEAGDTKRVNDQSGTPWDVLWPFKRPALTIAGRNLLNHPGANANRFNGRTKSRNDGYWLTEAEMAVLQGFRRDYPFQGTRSSQQTQSGHVVPPPMAAAVLGGLL